MKKNYLLFLVLLVQSVFVQQFFAQQVSIMQPVIKNSHIKLDSVYLSAGLIVRRSAQLEGLTEKWIAKEYDADKNPTKFMVYDYQDPYSNIINDSIRVTLEHYPINMFNALFKGSAMAGGYYRGYDEYMNSKIYNLFNLKSVTEEVFNTQTNQWVLSSFESNISDLRLAESYVVNKIEYDYDANFNVIHGSKIEGVIESQGYINEKTFFTWSAAIGFSATYKLNYYNTYNVDGKLTETIIKRIDDLVTGVEINSQKYNISYGASFFERTLQNWNADNNNWDTISKFRIDYINNNPVWASYDWINNNWTEFIHDETYPIFYFNNGMFFGSSQTTPTIGSSSHQLIYDENNFIINEIYNDSCGEGCGSYEEKEFYYSSDGTNSVIDYNLENLTIHPNPAKNTIYINLKVNISFVVYSVLGKELLRGETQNIIDISSLKKGVYFIQFKTENGFVNKQLIKQ